MDQKDIAAMFRQGELQRRAQRNAKILQNAAELENEPLTEFDKEAHATAVESVKRQQLRLEKELSPGYWRRLWCALLNK